MAIASSCVSTMEKPRFCIATSPESAPFCTLKTPVKETLDAWPALALIVMGTMTPTSGMDNIIVALGQNNHLCQVIFRGIAVWQLEKVLATIRFGWIYPTSVTLRVVWHSISGITKTTIICYSPCQPHSH